MNNFLKILILAYAITVQSCTSNPKSIFGKIYKSNRNDKLELLIIKKDKTYIYFGETKKGNTVIEGNVVFLSETNQYSFDKKTGPNTDECLGCNFSGLDISDEHELNFSPDSDSDNFHKVGELSD